MNETSVSWRNMNPVGIAKCTIIKGFNFLVFILNFYTLFDIETNLSSVLGSFFIRYLFWTHLGKMLYFYFPFRNKQINNFVSQKHDEIGNFTLNWCQNNQLSNDTTPCKIQVFHLISWWGNFRKWTVSASFRASGPKIWSNCPFTENLMLATIRGKHRTLELTLSLSLCYTPLNHTEKSKFKISSVTAYFSKYGYIHHKWHLRAYS